MARHSMYVPLDDPYGLSDSSIAARFPAVYQDHAAPKMSAKYEFYPTWGLIAGMRERGFVPTSVMESPTRIEGMQPFVTHLLWFTHLSSLPKVGQLHEKIYRVMLKNSHNGGSSLLVMSGLWVKVCRNGLTVGDVESSLRVKHMGNSMDDVFSAVYQTVDHSAFALGAADAMEQVRLDQEEIWLMGKYLLAARFQVPVEQTQVVEGEFRVLDDEQRIQKVAQIADFSLARHYEQREDSLFNVANRYEEGLRRGGQEVVSINKDGKQTERKARAVHGIQQTVSHQGLIWSFSEELYKMKTGKSLREAAGV